MKLGLGPPRIDGPVHIRIARRLLTWVLGLLAEAVLRRYRPVVVAITGSSGKTTTKDLAAAVLASRFDIRATKGTANNEVGVPAVVLGPRPGRSVWARLRVVFAGLSLLLRRSPYPEVLVIEMAAGRPGELQRLTRRIRPDVAVVTNVRTMHLEFYDDVTDIRCEKSWPVRRLRTSGTAVLNLDDASYSDLAALAPGRVISYGSSPEASVRLGDVELRDDGSTAVLHVEGAGEFALSSRLLGVHQLSGVLAAVGVGLALGIPPADAAAALSDFEPGPGRLRAHKSRNGLVVLDDTNNATPEAVVAGLAVLARLPGPRTAVLGSLIFLGPELERGHRTVGQAAAKSADFLVAVGEHADWIAEAAVAAGMATEDIVMAPNAEEAARIVADRVNSGATLVKGAGLLGLEAVVTALVPGAEVVRRN